MVQLLFVAVSLFAARGKGSGEGIGWFAAKRVDGVGRACVRDGSGNGRRFAPPPAPLKGGDGGETDKCRGRYLPDIAADSPTARRFVMVIGYRLLVIEKGGRDDCG